MREQRSAKKYPFDIDVIGGGRNGKLYFVIQVEDLDRCRLTMKHEEKFSKSQNAKYSHPWDNLVEREIESICAQHRAELVHVALVSKKDNFEWYKDFEWKGYRMQSVPF